VYAIHDRTGSRGRSPSIHFAKGVSCGRKGKPLRMSGALYARSRRGTLVVALAGLVVAGATILSYAGEDAFPIVTIPRLPAPPAIDARITPGEYDQAAAFTGFRRSGLRGAVYRSPVVYAQADASNLYFAVVSPLRPGERPVATVIRRDYSYICMDDSVELFIYPFKAGPRERDLYYQLLVNSREARFDARWEPSHGQASIQWGVPWHSRSPLRNDHEWVAEFKLPLRHFGIDTPGQSFRFDVCRNSPSFLHHFTSFAGAYHERQQGALAILADDAPIVRVISIGELPAGELDLRGNVIAPGGATPPLNLHVTVTSGGAVHLAEDMTLDAAGGTCDFALTRDLGGLSEGALSIAVTDTETGRMYYRQVIPFETGTPDTPILKTLPQAIRLAVHPAPTFAKAVADVDIGGFTAKHGSAQVDLALRRAGERDAVATATLPSTAFHLDFAQHTFDLPEPPRGEYVVDASVSGEGAPPYTTNATFSVKDWPWLGNTIGLDNRVLSPWTPLRVDGNSVHCWGRRYVFGGSGLPTQIHSHQPHPTRAPPDAVLLARPVTVTASVGGRRVAFEPGTLTMVSESPERVLLRGRLISHALRIDTQWDMDYDGFGWVTLDIEPANASVRIDELAVDVPLADAHARLICAVGDMVRGSDYAGELPAGHGRVWDSTACHNQLVKGSFVPAVWIGDEDRGLGYMADNDKGWVVDDEHPCIEIVRLPGEATLRLRIVNHTAELSTSRRVQFGIQASPVKPLPSGWRAWHRTTYQPTHDEWPTREWPGGSMLHTYGQKYPGRYETPFYWGTVHPTDVEASREYIDRYHKARMKMFLYLNGNKTGGSDPEYRAFAAEWQRIPGPEGGYTPVPSFQDYALWCLEDWFKTCNIDGIYMDDVFPVPSENLVNGQGYVGENGEVRAGYSLLAFRTYMKRLRAMLDNLGREIKIWTHCTNTPFPMYLGFADAFHDCENHGNPPEGIVYPDYIDRWPYENLDRFRATSLASKFGAVPFRLAKSIDRKLDADSIAALVLPHDIFFWEGDHTYFIWALSRFRIWEDDVQCIPYWSRNPKVCVSPPDTKTIATLWTRDDRAMFIVSNLDDCDLTLDVDVDSSVIDTRNIEEAVDGVTQQALSLCGNRIAALKVPRHDYRLVLLGPAGTYHIGEDTFGSELPDLAGADLPAWTSFDDGIPACWTFRGTPDVKRCHAGAWNGRLRIGTMMHRYAFVERAIDAETLTVQCRIELEGPNSCAPRHGPAVGLYWDNGHFVKNGLAPNGNSFKQDGPMYVRCIDDRIVDGPPLPMRRETFYLFPAWVRIRLDDQAILFEVSTDGRTWERTETVSRDERFTGPPAKLVLGCAHGSKATGYPNDGLTNDRDSATGGWQTYYHFSRLQFHSEP
jgi:hypothetical protein